MQNGVEFVGTTWKGHAGLGLDSNFEARSLHIPENLHSTVFETLSNELTLGDNGFRQTTKGRATERIKKKTNVARGGQVSTSSDRHFKTHKIKPSNAFSFNLPVNNRVIVNQVNIEYLILEKCTDPNNDRITIKKRDCLFDKTDPNKFTTTVKLEKVYDRIESIVASRLDLVPIQFFKLLSATSTSLTLEFITENKILLNLK